jgi:hypothetical protein
VAAYHLQEDVTEGVHVGPLGHALVQLLAEFGVELVDDLDGAEQAMHVLEGHDPSVVLGLFLERHQEELDALIQTLHIGLFGGHNLAQYPSSLLLFLRALAVLVLNHCTPPPEVKHASV